MHLRPTASHGWLARRNTANRDTTLSRRAANVVAGKPPVRTYTRCCCISGFAGRFTYTRKPRYQEGLTTDRSPRTVGVAVAALRTRSDCIRCAGASALD